MSGTRYCKQAWWRRYKKQRVRLARRRRRKIDQGVRKWKVIICLFRGHREKVYDYYYGIIGSCDTIQERKCTRCGKTSHWS